MSTSTTQRTSKSPYRCITRHTVDESLLMLPADDSAVPDRLYELLDTDKATILASGILGQDLLDARQSQLADYLAADKTRKNIKMVDVLEIIQLQHPDYQPGSVV